MKTKTAPRASQRTQPLRLPAPRLTPQAAGLIAAGLALVWLAVLGLWQLGRTLF